MMQIFNDHDLKVSVDFEYAVMEGLDITAGLASATELYFEHTELGNKVLFSGCSVNFGASYELESIF